jgi:hypothetical protein
MALPWWGDMVLSPPHDGGNKILLPPTIEKGLSVTLVIDKKTIVRAIIVTLSGTSRNGISHKMTQICCVHESEGILPE